MNDLREQLSTDLIALNSPLEDLQVYLDALIGDLLNHGHIKVKDERYLGGKALEFYVRRLCQQAGFSVKMDSSVDADAVLSPPDMEKVPIVIEVKSGKALGPTRDHLRQLDDWVYELSGEEVARKGNLGKGIEIDYVHMIPLGATMRWRSSGISLPNYHKGMFIYNCTQGTHFDAGLAETHWLGHNELQFAKSRDFCVVSFRNFVTMSKSVIDGAYPLKSLYKQILSTNGELVQLQP